MARLFSSRAEDYAMTKDYYTRALDARDPRYKQALDRLGYGTRHMTAATQEPEAKADEPEAKQDEDDIDALRAEAEGLGVEVDGRWGAKRLSDEIAKAKG